MPPQTYNNGNIPLAHFLLERFRGPIVPVFIMNKCSIIQTSFKVHYIPYRKNSIGVEFSGWMKIQIPIRI